MVGVLHKTHLILKSFPLATPFQQITRIIGDVAKIAGPFFGVGGVGDAFSGATDLFNTFKSFGDPKLATAMNANNPDRRYGGGTWGVVVKLAGGMYSKFSKKGGLFEKIGDKLNDEMTEWGWS
jgi:hypothetical protein